MVKKGLPNYFYDSVGCIDLTKSGKMISTPYSVKKEEQNYIICFGDEVSVRDFLGYFRYRSRSIGERVKRGVFVNGKGDLESFAKKMKGVFCPLDVSTGN